MSERLKIAIIGAGSTVFSEATIGDIMLSDTLANHYQIDLWLMDIVPEFLSEVEHFAHRAIESLQRQATVTATTELKPALDGADFVVTAIEVNRYYYWAQDFHIPRKYGFAQIYGENGGPGGMFHALRNMGPVLEIADTMEQVCPDAWMINFSNPEAKLVQAVSTLSNTKAVGMCHGVFGAYRLISQLLEIPVKEIEITCCGLNHFAWLQTITHKESGEGLYPLLREKEAQAHCLANWDELALNRMLFRTFGLWPYGPTNHSGEYLRWSAELMVCANLNYFYDPAAENPWQTGDLPAFVYDLRGKPTETPLYGSEDVKQVYPKFEARQFQEAGQIGPSGEETVLIMEGVACGVERELATVNMPNNGAVPGLPDELVVEAPAIADGAGICLNQMDPLPTGITAMIQLQGAIHQLIIEAYREQSRKKLLQAVLIDPTVSNYHNAVAMIDEMCELQERDLAATSLVGQGTLYGAGIGDENVVMKRSIGRSLPDAVVVGVDVGGTKILIGYVDEDGSVHRSRRYPMDGTTQESTLSSIESAVDDFMRSPWDGPAPLAMGLGLVGQTEPATGLWIRAMNLQVYNSVPLGSQLSERYGLPVRIDNDVHAATLTELRLGAGREFTDFFYLNVGTGIACGIVCNGRLVRGAVNYAGELGHMVVETGGDLCEQCGRRGCLEPIASGGGMLDQVRAGLVDYPDSLLHEPAESGHLTAGTIFEAADAGDPLASAVAERAMRALGVALVNLLNVLNPEIVLLGGGVARNRWAIARLRAHVAAKALPAAAQALKGIVPSQFVDQVGLVGAASLAWQDRADW